MDKQSVVHLYNGILLINKKEKEQTTDKCNKDESQMHYAKWKQPDIEAPYCVIIWHSGNGQKWLPGAEVRGKVDYRWAWEVCVRTVLDLDRDVWCVCQNLQNSNILKWVNFIVNKLYLNERF